MYKEKVTNIIKNLKKKNRLFKKFKLLLTVLLIISILYFIKGFFIAAIVNNYPISRFSVIKELEKQGGKQVLDSIINERLIFQEAAKKNIKVSQDEIDQEISRIEANLKAQNTDLETALSMQGQTKDDLIKAINLKLIIEKSLADRIKITQEEITAYFENNKATLFKNKKLDEVKDQIINTLQQQKLADEYQTWITEIKAKAKIIRLVDFEPKGSK